MFATNQTSINHDSSVKDVCEYLSQLSLNGCNFSDDIQTFENELVDGSCFLQLDKSEIMNLGIKKLSKRNMLYKHISELNSKMLTSDTDKQHSKTLAIATSSMQPNKIESMKSIKHQNFNTTQSIDQDAASYSSYSFVKSSKQHEITSKTQDFANNFYFDSDAPEFIPTETTTRPSKRRCSTALTISRKETNNVRTVHFAGESDDMQAQLQPQTIVVNLQPCNNDIIDAKSETPSSVLEYNLHELGYRQASTNEFVVNATELRLEGISDSLMNSIDTCEMEPSEVISLPPSVVMTDIIKPPQIGGPSQTNSVQNAEMVRSPFTSMDFAMDATMFGNIASPTHAGSSPNDIDTIDNNPTQSADIPTITQSIEYDTTSAASNVSVKKRRHNVNKSTTNAQYVVRLNVRKSSDYNDASIVTFPAVFKDLIKLCNSETQAILCMQRKTLKQLNELNNKLKNDSIYDQKHSSMWRKSGSNSDDTQFLFDESKCEHSFNVNNQQLSISFDSVECEDLYFRNVYFADRHKNSQQSCLLPSNALVMATYDMKNNCILDVAPMAVRGTIECLSDSNGVTWIKSDLSVNGSIKQIHTSNDDTALCSIDNLNLLDQRRNSSLVKDGQIIASRSVICINDESFDSTDFADQTKDTAKVEFYLKLKLPCQQLNGNMLVEAWNILKVAPSMRQQRKTKRRLSRLYQTQSSN